MFQPVKANRISDEISNQIRDVLMSGKVKAGDRLPTERQLAEQFGASRASVREALRGLEQQGVITIKKGVNGGVFVAHVDNTLVSRPMETLFRLKKLTIQDITEARLVFEPAAARLACERATAEDLAEMRQVIAHMEEAVRRGHTFRSYDLAFHRLIARASRNPIIEMLSQSMLEVASQYITRLKPSVETLGHVCKCHTDVHDAIQARDADRAYRLMKDHILDLQTRLSEREKSANNDKKQRTRAARVVSAP
jgi:GntR family transcriptional regulator, transcriptional repressor for pyruvate dehydrogenase complex